MPEDPDSTDEKKKKIIQNLIEESYTQKLDESKKSILKFWEELEKRPDQHEGKIIWDKSNDDKKTINKIIDLAMLLSKLRGTIPTWYTHQSDSGGTNYHYETPIIENPSRASNALYNLARGHAVLLGRNYITDEDLKVVIPVALSSASKDRVGLFRRLLESNGKQNTEQFMEKSQVSKSTALKEMKSLTILGLVDSYEEESSTKPVNAIKLKQEYNWFLSQEFKDYLKEFDSSLTLNFSKLSTKENIEKNGLSESLDDHISGESHENSHSGTK